MAAILFSETRWDIIDNFIRIAGEASLETFLMALFKYTCRTWVYTAKAQATIGTRMVNNPFMLWISSSF